MTDQEKRTEAEIFIPEGEKNRISEVVVFRDSAFVRRQVRTQASEGIRRFQVEIRAFSPEPDSVQATVYGLGEILGVYYREIPVKEAPQKDILELEKAKEVLERRKQQVNSEVLSREKQMRFLDSVVDFAGTEIPKKIRTSFPDAENLGTMTDFLGERFASIDRAMGELRLDGKEIEKELSVIERKLEKIRKTESASRKVIEILFDARKEGEIGIEAAYSSAGASWEPVYKADVPPDMKRVMLSMYARIQQNTGEHWSHAKMSVSNAAPVTGVALPEVNSWHLRKAAVIRGGDDMMVGAAMAAGSAKVRRKRSKAPEEEELFADLAEAAPEAEYRESEIRKLPLAFEYAFAQRVDLNSGGGDTLLPLFTRETASEFFVHAAPAVFPHACLAAEATPDAELLEGTLNVFFSGRYVGETRLGEQKAGETLSLNLGVEQGVKIRREKIRDKVNETFFGVMERNSIAREFAYRIVAENLKETPMRVKIFDAVPVSQSDRILVQGVELTPEPTFRDYREKTGVMVWDFPLEPGEVRKISIVFHVKYPKDSPPDGL